MGHDLNRIIRKSKKLIPLLMLTQEQIELMIESLEDLNNELSLNEHGTLFTEQWELLEYLKTLLT